MEPSGAPVNQLKIDVFQNISLSLLPAVKAGNTAVVGGI